jgi:hypothetical protein
VASRFLKHLLGVAGIFLRSASFQIHKPQAKPHGWIYRFGKFQIRIECIRVIPELFILRQQHCCVRAASSGGPVQPGTSLDLVFGNTEPMFVNIREIEGGGTRFGLYLFIQKSQGDRIVRRRAGRAKEIKLHQHSVCAERMSGVPRQCRIRYAQQPGFGFLWSGQDIALTMTQVAQPKVYEVISRYKSLEVVLGGPGLLKILTAQRLTMDFFHERTCVAVIAPKKSRHVVLLVEFIGLILEHNAFRAIIGNSSRYLSR